MDDQSTIKIIVIEDLDKICRTCLCKVEENTVQFESLYFKNKLEDIYSNITSIKVNQDDLLPKKVCTTCYDQIIKFYIFKTEAIKSEQLLTEALLDQNLNENEDEAPAVLENKEYEEVTKMVNNYLEEPPSTGNNTVESSEDEASEGLENEEYEEVTLEEPTCTVNKTIESNKDKAFAVLENDEYVEVTKMVDNSLEGPTCIVNNTVVNKSIESIIDSIIESNRSILGNTDPKKLLKKPDKKETRNKGVLGLECEKSKTFVKQRKKRKTCSRKRVPCNQCGKVVLSDRMSTHMRTHTKERPYVCETCGATFSDKSNLLRHNKTHLGERPHKCEICDKGFLRREALRVHITTVHNNEANFLCPECGKAFKNKYLLTRHMLVVHNKTITNEGVIEVTVSEPGYACSICGYLCKTKAYLQIHESTHTEVKRFLCNFCGKGYRAKTTLDDHLRVHTGEKPFSCKICQKRFLHLRSIKSHMLMHRGEKPISCPVCDKKFRDRSNLGCHMRGQHSGKRPHKCILCSKTFKHRSNLLEHMTTHSGETRYHCDICQKGFYYSSNLRKHKKVHNTEKSENLKDE